MMIMMMNGAKVPVVFITVWTD